MNGVMSSKLLFIVIIVGQFILKLTNYYWYFYTLIDFAGMGSIYLKLGN